MVMQEERHREISKGSNIQTDIVAFAEEERLYGDRQQKYYKSYSVLQNQFKGNGQTFPRSDNSTSNASQKMFTAKRYFYDH